MVWPGAKRTAGRWWAWVGLVAGPAIVAYGIYLSVLEHRQEQARERLQSLLQASSPEPESQVVARQNISFATIFSDTEPVDMDAQRDFVPNDEIPRPELDRFTGGADSFFVRPAQHGPGGDGSLQSPWSGLQSALDSLSPGGPVGGHGGQPKSSPAERPEPLTHANFVFPVVGISYLRWFGGRRTER